jgi:hypothetical protein
MGHVSPEKGMQFRTEGRMSNNSSFTGIRKTVYQTPLCMAHKEDYQRTLSQGREEKQEQPF